MGGQSRCNNVCRDWVPEEAEQLRIGGLPKKPILTVPSVVMFKLPSATDHETTL